MKKRVTFGVALVLSLGATEFASAHADHGAVKQAPRAAAASQAGQMGGSQAEIMKNMMSEMMQMHAEMAGDGISTMMGGLGTMPGLSVMDQDMMKLMMGPEMMQKPLSDWLGTAMESSLVEFDADGNGSLSLAEFESLHESLSHQSMVDRFQHLDDNGDGQVTKDELAAPSRRMKALAAAGDGGESATGGNGKINSDAMDGTEK